MILRKLLVLLFLGTAMTAYAQIILDSSLQTSYCSLGSLGTISISVPTESLTGDLIPLNINLSGTLPSICVKRVSIETEGLEFVSSGSFPFSVDQFSPNTYILDMPLPGNDAQNFNVFFKFPNYTTCNGEIGTLKVNVIGNCDNGSFYSCQLEDEITARADNYWSIDQRFYLGELACGKSLWQFIINHNNPNGIGLGTYNNEVNIVETVGLPVLDGGNGTYLLEGGQDFSSIFHIVTLENCLEVGNTITNTANYSFNLGCELENGVIEATSPPLTNQVGSVSFEKLLPSSSSANRAAGCNLYYHLRVFNNSNETWGNLHIEDNLNIQGISIQSIGFPSGWTSDPVIPSNPNPSFFEQSFSFTSPPAWVLGMSSSALIRVNFMIDENVPQGTLITNTATLSYEVGNSPLMPKLTCSNINCPIIPTSVQNTDATVTFEVEPPRVLTDLHKCIMNPNNGIEPPVYQIGDTIMFRLEISNFGNADLDGNLIDDFTSGQNLALLPETVSYSYMEGVGRTSAVCQPIYSPSPILFTIDNLSMNSPLEWEISNMPGICDFGLENTLIVEYSAFVLPQIAGVKTNSSTLNYFSSSTSASVNYAVDEVGILGVSKNADKTRVNINEPFNYLILITNNGSVPLNNVSISDTLPDCSPLDGTKMISITFDGIPVGFTNEGTDKNLVLKLNPSQALLPSESCLVTIPVIKEIEESCCNVNAMVNATMPNSTSLIAIIGDQFAPAFCTGLLPVELSRFEAKRQKDFVILEWTGHPNPTHSHFEIERSLDAKTWLTIGSIEDKDFLNTKNFSLVDRFPFMGPNYYRLKSIDYDGTSAYSPIRFVRLYQTEFQITPNPISSIAILSIPAGSKPTTHVQIFNTNGQLVLDLGILATDRQHEISLQALPTGIYFLSQQNEVSNSAIRFIKN